jgi:hypothetical protein
MLDQEANRDLAVQSTKCSVCEEQLIWVRIIAVQPGLR